jgi:hypothetical protein
MPIHLKKTVIANNSNLSHDLPYLPARSINLIHSLREGKRDSQAPFRTHFEISQLVIFAELSLDGVPLTAHPGLL